MIVLDTNVISETFRPTPDAGVLAWLDDQPRESLFTTTPSVAEIRYGIVRLAKGRRRVQLMSLYEQMIGKFDQRILPFDFAAAEVFSELFVERVKGGRSAGIFDLAIAAVAKSRGAAVATRNITHFDMIGIPVINPWSA